MNDSTDDDFDFEALAALAEDSPEDFEAVRQKMIAAIIDSAPAASRRRLEGLQWQVDMVRERATHPMGACVEISRLMWEKVSGPGGLLESINRLSDPDGAPPAPDPAPVQTADVVPLSARRTRPDPADSGH